MGRWLVRVFIGSIVAIAAIAVVGTRYITAVPGVPYQGALPPLTDAEKTTAARLLGHIQAIGGKPHNIEHYDELEKSARYIEEQLKALGYEPVPQVYEADGRQVYEGDGRKVRNIEVVIEPAAANASTGAIVLGAHYDSCEDAPALTTTAAAPQP